MKDRQIQYMPPFSMFQFSIDPKRLLDPVVKNPHPTDLLLDSSVFSRERISLVKNILTSFSPILLTPVVKELEDLKAKPALADLCDLVFPGGVLNARFRGDDRNVLTSYPRFSLRYASLLRWRRNMIDILVRRIEKETGSKPVGKSRAKLIRELIGGGMAIETIKLANKDYRLDRPADELLAVFAVLSPIVTGRDCFLFTADEDVYEQTLRMSKLLFEDYGAYLMAKSFRADESQYKHRHPYVSPLFVGEAEAIGRVAHPDYLLPPPALIKTCATIVVDVGRLKSCIWISAINMHAAVSFQEHDPLGRKGDPGTDRSILFTPPEDKETAARCKQKHHFVLCSARLLKLIGGDVGPVPFFDLVRATASSVESQGRRSKIVTPFADYQQRLLERMATEKWR